MRTQELLKKLKKLNAESSGTVRTMIYGTVKSLENNFLFQGIKQKFLPEH